MLKRGSGYWVWADCKLHCLRHTEALAGDVSIDVQVRMGREGAVQVFFGVYNGLGVVIAEEFRNCEPCETGTSALLWATAQARTIAVNPVFTAQQAFALPSVRSC